MEEKHKEQYEEIGLAIAMNGIGYSLYGGGYVTPDMTDDPELKKYIEQAIEGIEGIMKIVEPYVDDM